MLEIVDTLSALAHSLTCFIKCRCSFCPRLFLVGPVVVCLVQDSTRVVAIITRAALHF